MSTRRTFLALPLALFACGGSKLPAWTAAQIGCPADQIVITNDEHVWTERTWRALCQGKSYSCVEHHEGEPNVDISCHEVKPSE
ncbi:MAG: hypothetical protein ACRENE_16125 [Polyangiaceae bacterium]